MKYQKGDCLSIDCGNNHFIAVVVTTVSESSYGVTLVEYYESIMPSLATFAKAKLFGTRYGSLQEVTYALDIRMMNVEYLEGASQVQKMGTLDLVADVAISSQSVVANIKKLLDDYAEELPVRIKKSELALAHPDLGFVGMHLIEFDHIIL